METRHVQPAGHVFTVYPCPYFMVRNPFLKRWAGLMLLALAEAFQHTENRKTMEISVSFGGLIGQYLTRIYANMAIELFGKTRAETQEPGFLLSDADFAAYDPTQFFTATEMIDTVPPLQHVATEDSLYVLAEGINVTDLPELGPWPVNLIAFYKDAARGAGAGSPSGDGSAPSDTTVMLTPPAP